MRNVDISILPPAAYTAASRDVPYTNNDGGALEVFINVTNNNGGTLTVTVQSVDPVSGVKTTILASAGIVANGMTVLKIAPGLTPAANAVASDIVPRSLNINVLVATATMTFSIGGSLTAQ